MIHMFTVAGHGVGAAVLSSDNSELLALYIQQIQQCTYMKYLLFI